MKERDIKKEVLALYPAMRVMDIAKRIGCDPTTVRYHLKKTGVYEHSKWTREKTERFIEEYYDNTPLYVLAEKYDMAVYSVPCVVSYLCKKFNIVRSKRRKKWDEETCALLVRMYNNGKSVEEIGKVFFVCKRTVYRLLQVIRAKDPEFVSYRIRSKHLHKLVEEHQEYLPKRAQMLNEC